MQRKHVGVTGNTRWVCYQNGSYEIHEISTVWSVNFVSFHRFILGDVIYIIKELISFSKLKH